MKKKSSHNDETNGIIVQSLKYNRDRQLRGIYKVVKLENQECYTFGRFK